MPSELRQAARSLLRSPASSLSIVLILALGAGANTGAFSALYGLLLKPLPYPDPAQLVELYETTVDRKPRGVAMANLLDWRARAQLFEAMAAYQPRTFGLTRGERDAVTVVQTGMVMPEFFAALGVAPSAGRVFGEREDAVLVLSDRLWRRMFAGADVIGRQVELNEEPYTVVGVMPPGFEYPMGAALPEAYLPLSRRDYCCARLGSQAAVARVKPGVSLDRARAELDAVAATNDGRSAGLRPLQQTLTGARREPLFLLAGAAALLLAIACANVAGLLLARAQRRRREFEIRLWLGAGIGRLLRPFFFEAALLAACGAALGLGAAQLILALVPRFIPVTEAPRLDAAAFLGAIAIAAGLALLLGAAPAMVVLRRTRPRGWLVITQVALSVVLLLGAAVLLRSFLRLVATSPGFSTVHALRFGIGIPEKRYDTEQKLIAFHRDLERALSELPGVVSAGAAIRAPLRGGTPGPGGAFQIAGSNLLAHERPRASINVASPGYFSAMGIPLLEGRAFSWQHDRPGEHPVAIVNQTFVRTYLRGRRPVGALLDVQSAQREIVGVVADMRQADLQHEPSPEIFLSMTQAGSEGGGYTVRARSDDPALPHAIAAAVARQDPRIERVRVEPLAALVERNLEARDVALRLVGGCGALALLLTAIGIYGAVAFRAAERQREMAIRSALGATAPHLRRLVLGHGAKLALGGTAAGLAGFTLVYGVSAVDPLSIAAVAAGVLAVALAASLAPSLRAGRSAPMDLLREL